MRDGLDGARRGGPGHDGRVTLHTSVITADHAQGGSRQALLWLLWLLTLQLRQEGRVTPDAGKHGPSV